MRLRSVPFHYWAPDRVLGALLVSALLVAGDWVGPSFAQAAPWGFFGAKKCLESTDEVLSSVSSRAPSQVSRGSAKIRTGRWWPGVREIQISDGPLAGVKAMKILGSLLDSHGNEHESLGLVQTAELEFGDGRKQVVLLKRANPVHAQSDLSESHGFDLLSEAIKDPQAKDVIVPPLGKLEMFASQTRERYSLYVYPLEGRDLDPRGGANHLSLWKVQSAAAAKTAVLENARMSRDLLRAVGVLVRKGIVHRDLKGANVVTKRDGSGYGVIDFGIAVRAGIPTHDPRGTPGYEAPESYDPKEIARPEWDLYSIGAILAEHLTGLHTQLPNWRDPGVSHVKFRDGKPEQSYLAVEVVEDQLKLERQYLVALRVGSDILELFDLMSTLTKACLSDRPLRRRSLLHELDGTVLKFAQDGRLEGPGPKLLELLSRF